LRLVFWHSDKPRERLLANAFLDGLRKHGDTGEMRPLSAAGDPVDASFDAACMVGVKSKELFQRYSRAGVPVIYFDKGYCRHKSEAVTRSWEYWRLAFGAHQPTRYLMKVKRPSDRWNGLGLEPAPWRNDGEHIVFAGSSAKYHDFYDLPAPTPFAEKVFRRLRGQTRRPLIYRPKPSWRDATPIEGTTYSEAPQTIIDVLRNAHALVTHGSNACFEALLAGVPCIIIGDAVAKPLSSTELDEIEAPRFSRDKERMQWFYNLAYQQWTMSEMNSGQAWEILRPYVYE
jgi:hypothetical protein